MTREELRATPRLGDWVTCHIADGRGCPPTRDLVIGEMAYSDGKGLYLLIGTEQVFGMPVGSIWLTPTGERDVALAWRLRQRYIAQYPHTLLPTTEPTDGS